MTRPGRPQDVLTSFMQGLSDAAQRAREAFSEAFPGAVEFVVRGGLEAVGITATAYGRVLERSIPPNWLHMTFREMRAVADFMAQSGWSLAWTPPHETALAIVRASDDGEREAALLAEDATICSDLDRFLDEIDSPTLTTLCSAAREALEAYRDGHFRASQALSAACMGSIAHTHFAAKSLGKARAKLRQLDPATAEEHEYRRAAVQTAAAHALESARPESLSPTHPPFRRSLSVHYVDAPQYRQANALRALMLIVAVTVELQELEDPPPSLQEAVDAELERRITEPRRGPSRHDWRTHWRA